MTKKGITGKHVLFGMISFFSVVIAVNAVFLTAAVKSFPGETVDQSYRQGIEFNETLANRRAQDKLGWRAEIGVTTDAVSNPLIMARFLDEEGMALSDLSVEATATRHDGGHDIVDLDLPLRNVGEYAVDASTLHPGRWSISMIATSPSGDPFEATKTLVIP